MSGLAFFVGLACGAAIVLAATHTLVQRCNRELDKAMQAIRDASALWQRTLQTHQPIMLVGNEQDVIQKLVALFERDDDATRH